MYAGEYCKAGDATNQRRVNLSTLWRKCRSGRKQGRKGVWWAAKSVHQTQFVPRTIRYVYAWRLFMVFMLHTPLLWALFILLVCKSLAYCLQIPTLSPVHEDKERSNWSLRSIVRCQQRLILHRYSTHVTWMKLQIECKKHKQFCNFSACMQTNCYCCLHVLCSTAITCHGARECPATEWVSVCE